MIYLSDEDCYICTNGKKLNVKGMINKNLNLDISRK